MRNFDRVFEKKRNLSRDMFESVASRNLVDIVKNLYLMKFEEQP